MSTSLATRVMSFGVHSKYEAPTGLSFPGIFAMMAHLYAKRYNIPLPALKEAMSMVSFKAHKHGCINPKAQFFGKQVTMQTIYDSAMVASPLQVYDCCPISDGPSSSSIKPTI
ncbi:hypothetical protein ES708_33476 [subsurface metagenome]